MSERLQMPLEERLILALDLPDMEQARKLVDTVSPVVDYFKIGLELFLAAGLPMVRHVLDRGCKVMLDLKFYDVPNTVAAAVRQTAGSGVSLLTLHGDPAIMQAAAQAAREQKTDCGLLAVTALTSLSQADLEAMGFLGSVQDLVLSRARLARDAGLAGIVCSPREVAQVRRELGWGLRVVTPGVRPSQYKQGSDDQKRVATPAAAIAAGADQIVMGRPVRQDPEPLGMARRVLEEIDQALQTSGR